MSGSSAEQSSERLSADPRGREAALGQNLAQAAKSASTWGNGSALSMSSCRIAVSRVQNSLSLVSSLGLTSRENSPI